MNQKKIKLSLPSLDWPILQQTPGSLGIWENCKFFANAEISECDYWVIMDDVQTVEKTICPEGNTLLITGEPPDIKKYHRKFTDQFGSVLSCNPAIKHKNLQLWQQALPWHIGRRQIGHKNIQFTKSYDKLKEIREYRKDKLISMIVSDKIMSEGHRQRLEFVKFLRKESKIAIDFFGRGFNEIEDKWDAIYPYQYHIVLENCSYQHYWTEKLTDCFLGGAYPIYFGCPNIHDYFSKASMTTINIFNMQEALAKIEYVIAQHLYEKSVTEIAASKELCLDKYNLFPVICRLANDKTAGNERRQETTIYPEHFFARDTGLVNLLKRPVRKIKSILK